MFDKNGLTGWMHLCFLMSLACLFFLFLGSSSQAHADEVASRGKYVKHIQMLHVYSTEYEGKKLKNKKIVEFGFGRGDDFEYYVTKADVHITIRSMDGTVVYKKTKKVTGKNFEGELCHITVKDSEIKKNAQGEEGMAEVTATLKDGSKVKCGVGKAKVYRLPTTGKKPVSPQVIPSAPGFSKFRLINDARFISPDAYQRLGSTQGFASDGKGNFLAFNISSPGVEGKHSHMLTWIGADGKNIYYRFHKKLGHVNDATYYKGRFFVVTPKSGLPLAYGLTVKPKGKSLSVSWKKYHADDRLRSETGNKVNAITYCDGQKYKGYPVFVMRHGSVLYRCYLKGDTFCMINKNRLKNIPDSYVIQNVTWFKGKIYMGFAKLDRFGDKKNWLVVGTIPYSDVSKSGSRKLTFSSKSKFSDAKGVEVEGAAVNGGKLYFSFNGNDLYGRQADMIVRME